MFYQSDPRRNSETVVRSTSTSIEGVPAEFAGYLVQILRRGVRDCFLVAHIDGSGCDGGWAGFELRDLVPHASVCASWCTEDLRLEWATHFLGQDPEWPKTQGWRLDDESETYQREFPKLYDPASARHVMQNVMLAAQSVFGIVPPWLWTLEISGSALNRPGDYPDSFDLHKLGNGGRSAPPGPTVYPCCTEVGYLAHVGGACDLHLPCQQLVGCGTDNRTVVETSGDCESMLAFIRGT